LSLGGVYIYVSSVEAEIAALEADKNRMAAETQALSADVERYNSLNQKIELLESKKFSLKRITESKLVRFLPHHPSGKHSEPEALWRLADSPGLYR
jgi:hypothetical protein